MTLSQILLLMAAPVGLLAGGAIGYWAVHR
jgi:uncharacterized protein YneF (UPF0154 family)